MTEKRFLLIGLNEEGDFWHPYMKKTPRKMFHTLEEAIEAGKTLKDEEFEIWKINDDGEFEFEW